MSRIEFSAPADLHPVLSRHLTEAISDNNWLAGQYVDLQAARGEFTTEYGLNLPNPDAVIGADVIDKIPFYKPDAAGKAKRRANELDRRFDNLRRHHNEIMQESEASLWEVQPVLEAHMSDFIATAAVIETVTPYDGTGQVIADRVRSTFDQMKWRLAFLQPEMTVLGFEAIGTEQMVAFGGVIQAVDMRRAPNTTAVILDVKTGDERTHQRTLPSLLHPADPGYLFARREQSAFVEQARDHGIGIAEIDQSLAAVWKPTVQAQP